MKFKKVRYKNFQGVGNYWIEILLDRSNTTLIGGKNGAGKSTVLEAITYALFGKTLKKVNLGGLINSTNKKGLVVELEFEDKGNEFKIIRGQKPGIFEFYINGELQDQSAGSRDYQERLEKKIGFDFKLFVQVVVLNKEKYVPFMDLDSATRRKICDDILDTGIFTKMLEVIKKQAEGIPNSISDKSYEHGKLVERASGVVRLIDQAKQNTQSTINALNQEIEELRKQIDSGEAEIESLTHDVLVYKERLKPQEKQSQTKVELEMFANKFTAMVSNLNKEEKFYHDSNSCPTCKQGIDDAFKQNKICEIAEEKKKIQEASVQLAEQYQTIITSLKESQKLSLELNGILEQIAEHNRTKTFAESQIRTKETTISALSKKNSDVSALEEELEKLNEEVRVISEEINRLSKEKDEYDICKALLKDDAIKASVVDEYIQFINKKLNEYLNNMEYYLNITFDKNFDETINSVNRDNFTYDNLSTGQKCRVNLAVWLTLLEVASLKNSINTNILFLDEILEPLDSNGVYLFMKLVKEKLPGKNVFVISQRFDELKDYFHSEIVFDMKDDFTMKV